MLETETTNRRDLDTPEAIHEMVQAFYARLMEDPLMRPVFVDTAGVDLETHLPMIEAYWRKMLLGEREAYTRNMVARHEDVHAEAPLREEHFERWGNYFHQTLNERFSGPSTRRAHRIADRVLANLQHWLITTRR